MRTFEGLAAALVAAEAAAHLSDDDSDDRRAAVAIVLRVREAELDVLLMRRVENPNDRWSGQVSLPGGHHDATDRDLLHTAERETFEEVGVRLDESGRLLGAMENVQARARGKIVPMRITPFVFELVEDVSPSPGPEASEAFWFPLHRAASGELDEEFRYTRDDGVARELPCWRFGDRIVWGLTYFMLSDLIALLHADRDPS